MVRCSSSVVVVPCRVLLDVSSGVLEFVEVVTRKGRKARYLKW